MLAIEVEEERVLFVGEKAACSSWSPTTTLSLAARGTTAPYCAPPASRTHQRIPRSAVHPGALDPARPTPPDLEYVGALTAAWESSSN